MCTRIFLMFVKGTTIAYHTDTHPVRNFTNVRKYGRDCRRGCTTNFMTFPNTTAIAFHIKKRQALLFVWYAISVVFGHFALGGPESFLTGLALSCQERIGPAHHVGLRV
jgi:hypothetical protein